MHFLRSARRLALLAAALLPAVPSLAAGGAARPADHDSWRAACDAPAFAATVAAIPEGAPVLPARAVWLDRSTLQWPGVAGSGRFALAWSARGAIIAEPGHALRGADALAPLRLADKPLPEGVSTRFRYLAAGARLAIDPASLARLPQWLQGQLVVVQQDDDGRVLQASALQAAGALDDWYAGAADVADLGATPGHASTGFALWAPTARRVGLCRYAGAEGRAAAVERMTRDAATGVWRTRVRGDASGGYYSYLVEVFVPGIGLVRNRVTDPYSASLNADSRRSYVADLGAASLRPAGWREHRAPASVRGATDLAIYELHVRDFSAGDASVPPAHRGKYLAFTDALSRGMRHLRALAAAGMTDVHLLPVFDFATVPERGCVTPAVSGGPADETQQAAVVADAARDCFNWGYDPLHYSAPEGSYATDANDGAVRVREFRAMVQALHETGLRVGMDVVYNHTSASGQRAQSVLDRIVPGYYQRLDAEGAVEHSTCCDNTATENLMMGKLLVDSVVQWAVQYRIDSFRFDLMGHQPRALMEALQRRLRTATGREIPLIGEGWNFGEVADGARFVQASQLSLNGTGIATFNDRLRDAARGGSATDNSHPRADQGWLNGEFYDPNGEGHATREDLLAAADLVRAGLAGSLRDFPLVTWHGPELPLERIDYHGQPAGYASAPGEVANYVENHDNQTLFDIDVLRLPTATSAADRARVQILGAALVAFGQGVAYFHAGIDTLRSKSMDRNSFDSGDWFNRLDWSYTDNGFGAGLPPKADNGGQWDVMRPLLADAAIKPAPADIAWTRDAFRDLLRIRASTSLFHLASAAQVRERLSFPNSGPAQEPTVIVGLLDGRGLEGAGFRTLAYFVNADKQAHELQLPELRDQGWALHPVHLAAEPGDSRIAEQARVDDARGAFTIPARSAVVFVVH
jgi:pullulanase/glycogen debranching enzyme